jgi:hypothetical protein
MRNIAPPGSSTIAGSPLTPGILISADAQSKPAFEALAKLAGTVELDMARADRGFHQKIAHENAGHCAQVGRNIEAHVIARIGWTKIDLLAVADEPPVALRRRLIGKIEPD